MRWVRVILWDNVPEASMLTIVMVVHIIVSIVLIISVLLQMGKGASIGSTFGSTSSQTLFGSSGPASMLAKLTTGCAVVFMLTSLFLTYNSSKHRSSSIMSDVPAITQPAAPVPAEIPATDKPQGQQ